MTTTLTTTLNNHEKAVLAEAKGIIHELINEFVNSVYITVKSQSPSSDGDQWELTSLEEIEEILFSLFESNTLEGA